MNRHMKKLLFAALVLCSGLAHAACPPRALKTPDQVSLADDSVLIVTHASTSYDARLASKPGIDLATHFARRQGMPLVYLQDDAAGQNYFTEECTPEYWVFSPNGELGFQVESSHVFVAGGHLEQCLFTTVNEVFFSWSGQDQRDLTLTFLMDAIYSSGELIREDDEYYSDFSAFMRVLTHGRTDEDAPPKITLLETMGVIGQQKRAVEYLKRVLPNFENTLSSDYRVELYLNGAEVAVLQDAPAWNSPLLKIRFEDSASRLKPI